MNVKRGINGLAVCKTGFEVSGSFHRGFGQIRRPRLRLHMTCILVYLRSWGEGTDSVITECFEKTYSYTLPIL